MFIGFIGLKGFMVSLGITGFIELWCFLLAD